jgi:hypothetical protein
MMPVMHRTEVPMRRTLPLQWLLCAALGAAALAIAAPARPAAAQSDPRAQARDHYVAGKKLYDAGAYQQAIGEFTAADQLSPSGVNDFNIGLCYDALGDAANAIAHYKSYLTRVPDAPNRVGVEASVARLNDVAKKQEAEAAAKKAADDAAAKKAADEAAAKKAADDAAAKKAADEAAAKDAAKNAPGGVGATGGRTDTIVAPAPPAHTGDADLDKVAAVDVNAIRAQRRGVAEQAPNPNAPAPAGGVPAGTTAGGAAAGTAGGVATAAPNAGAPTPNTGASSLPAAPPEQPKETPAYKKWWFWAIVGVGVIVAIEVLTPPDAKTTRHGAIMDMPSPGPASTGGVELFHF